jgi:hypothetical protein
VRVRIGHVADHRCWGALAEAEDGHWIDPQGNGGSDTYVLTRAVEIACCVSNKATRWVLGTSVPRLRHIQRLFVGDDVPD